MYLNRKRYLLPTAIMVLIFNTPVLADDVAEETISLQDLPAAVANTIQNELGNKQADEIEKISYEGIVVLYEAEWYENGEEYEIYVYPNGDLAARHSHEEEEKESESAH